MQAHIDLHKQGQVEGWQGRRYLLRPATYIHKCKHLRAQPNDSVATLYR
jgi:hypothetical protein